MPYAPTQAGWRRAGAYAWRDLREGASGWRIWFHLAMRAMSNQYRRTVLGPWWITVQMAIFTCGLSVVWGWILQADLGEFLPYVALGVISFGLASGLVESGARAFTGAGVAICSSTLPLSTYVLRGVAEQVLQFLHNIVLYLPIAIAFAIPLTPSALWAVPALVLIVAFGAGAGLWLGPLVSRWRDLGPLVAAVMRLMFFFTPIFWQESSLSAAQRTALSSWNPFAYMVNAMRGPLLGEGLDWPALAGTAAAAVVSLAAGVIVFTRSRSRIPLWV